MQHKRKGFKKAFTLTELLVVVVIIGVLATVVMPKYGRMLDTRKTTEAEEIMRAIRTEQERRCSLGKDYATNFNQLADLVPANSNYYAYSLLDEGKGVAAATNEGSLNYTLKMPSVVDGRICCEGVGCNNLNKDYPLCSDFHYVRAGKCSGEVSEGDDPDDPEEPDPGYTGCTGTAPLETKTCQDINPNSCGSGLQTLRYYCDEETQTWATSGIWEGSDCTPKRTEMVTETGICDAGGGGLFGQSPATYKYRSCNVTYDCNGAEESRQCGEWSSCNDTQDVYGWVQMLGGGGSNCPDFNGAEGMIPPWGRPWACSHCGKTSHLGPCDAAHEGSSGGVWWCENNNSLFYHKWCSYVRCVKNPRDYAEQNGGYWHVGIVTSSPHYCD